MSKFDHLIEEGYSFDMGRYFSDGWDIFKQNAGSYLGFGCILFLIFLVSIFIPGVSLVYGLIQGSLIAGIYLYSRASLTGQQEFNQFFSGFNYIGQILLHSLVVFLFFIPAIILMFTVMIPFELLPDLFSGASNPEYFAEDFAYLLEGRIAIFLGVGLLILGFGIYLTTSYFLVVPLIADEGMQFWEAMETSRKIVAKNFFSFFGLQFVIGLMTVVGAVVTCYVGLYVFIMPLTSCIVFATYDSILDPKKDESLTSQIDEFGQQDHDINTESQDQ